MVMFDAIDEIFTKIAEFSDYSKALVTLATAFGSVVIMFLTLRLIYSTIWGKHYSG